MVRDSSEGTAPLVRVSIRIPEHLLHELDSLARTLGCSRAKVINALRLYIDEHRVLIAMEEYWPEGSG